MGWNTLDYAVHWRASVNFIPFMTTSDILRILQMKPLVFTSRMYFLVIVISLGLTSFSVDHIIHL